MEKLLLDEVLKLGGSEEDFKMLANLEDSSECVRDFDGPSPSDKKMIKELKSLLNTLQFKEASKEVEDDEEINDAPISEAPAVESLPVSDVEKYIKNSRSKMLFEPGMWYENATEEITACENSVEMAKTTKIALAPVVRAIGKVITTTEQQLSAEKKAKTSPADHQWFSTVIKNGTLSDKLSALCLAISESLIHSTRYLEELLAMAKKKSRREASLAIDTLKDVFLGSNSGTSGIIPDERKLVFFQEQRGYDLMLAYLIETKVVNNKGIVLKDLEKLPANIARTLSMWYVEDLLKRIYYQTIVTIDTLGKDSVSQIKSSVLKAAWELLVNKSEQERTLLTMMINKFGDNDKKTASNTVFLILKLLERHPVMKLAVIKEVEIFIYREGIQEKAQYYAMIFLNQIPFRDGDAETAQHICKLYFKHFENALSNQKVELSDINAKIMSAILTGISRAFPFALADDPAHVIKMFEQNIDYLFRAVHMPSLSFSASAQALQILARITFSDNNKHGSRSPVTVNNLYDRFVRAVYATLMSPRISDGAKSAALYLNVVFRCLSNCQETASFSAVAKRSLQMVASGVVSDDCAFVNALLAALSESLKNNPNKSIMTFFKIWATEGPERKLSAFEDDEEERFVDVDSEDENTNKSEANNVKEEVSKKKPYDPFGRSPLFAGADLVSPWELILLSKHYHPTVRMFAEILMKKPNEDGQETLINYPSDPLNDFTTARFLDKFVYRNPKKKDAKQQSCMKPDESTSKVTRETLHMKRSGDVPLSSAHWKAKHNSGSKIPADEEFFAEYLTQQQQTGAGKSKTKKSRSGEISEDEVERAIMNDMNAEEWGSDGEDVDEDAFREAMEDEEGANENENENEYSDIDEGDFGEDQEVIDGDEGLDSADDDIESELDIEEEMPLSKSASKKKKNKILDKSLKNAMSGMEGAVFASMEEFSHLLDDPSFDDSMWEKDQEQKAYTTAENQKPAKRKKGKSDERSRKKQK